MEEGGWKENLISYLVTPAKEISRNISILNYDYYKGITDCIVYSGIKNI